MNRVSPIGRSVSKRMRRGGVARAAWRVLGNLITSVARVAVIEKTVYQRTWSHGGPVRCVVGQRRGQASQQDNQGEQPRRQSRAAPVRDAGILPASPAGEREGQCTHEAAERDRLAAPHLPPICAI